MDNTARLIGLVDKPLLAVLQGVSAWPPPVWLMRQAGRYLPEYRAVRARAGGFLDLVFDPALAAEVTLQPRRRFDLDALILFSDILVVPLALGRALRFAEGEGPVLEALGPADLSVLEDSVNKAGRVYAPIYETLARVVELRAQEGFAATALLGFCGGPWSVAAYMIEGGAAPGFPRACAWALQEAESLDRLLAVLVESAADYLAGQVAAGAEAVQIFESHAGLLRGPDFQRFVISPTAALVAKLRAVHPDVKIIGFPRAAASDDRVRYFRETGVDALGLDQQVAPAEARALQQNGPVQGWLDPDLLRTGGEPMLEAARNMLDTLAGRPFIFNLGHGVVKDTPPEHVAALVSFVKKGGS